VKENLKHEYEVIGYVNPGAETGEIMKSAKSKIKELSKSDFVEVIGGTNDIGKNNANKTIKNLTNFVHECPHTNVIVTSATHRHDLSEWSCVNNEVVL